MFKILVIEDDHAISDNIKDVLQEIADITQMYAGDTGLFEAESELYDLIVLDIMLPEMNGYEILSTLREGQVATPVLMLTAKDGLEDKIKGFKVGADDYLPKPFHRDELLLRVEALLRRTLGLTTTHTVSYGNTFCDLLCHTVKIDETSVAFPGKEFDMLVYLLQQQQRILTKEQLFDRIWGFESETSYTVVEVYMSNLRKKLKAHQSDVAIKTIRNVGYLLTGEQL